MNVPDPAAASLGDRLAGVARDGLSAFRPATEVLPRARPDERAVLERAIAAFAARARGLVGWDRLPDPVAAWATVGPSGEVGLRRALPGGTLELRAWEGRFTLFRRIREGGLSAARGALDLVLAGGASELGEPTRAETVSPGLARLEWRRPIRDGRFVALELVTDGKETAFVLEPPYEGYHPETSHESAPEDLLEAAAARPRPPGATAIPAPLALPPGGRFARPRSRKRRRSGPGSSPGAPRRR